MARFDRSITIAAPLSQAWALVGDPLRWPEFHAIVDRAERLPDGTYRLSGGSERRPFAYVIAIEAQPPDRLAWRYVEHLHGGGLYELRERDGGTAAVRMVESLRLNLPVPFRWFVDWLVFRRVFRRDAKRQLQRLKLVLEGGAGKEGGA